MKILFFKWNSFMYEGIERALNNLGIEYEIFNYNFKDWEKDDDFLQKFSSYIEQSKGIDIVLSIDYSPLIAKVCKEKEVPYAAWIYDSPLHIKSKEEMHFDTTYLFDFDRSASLERKSEGIKCFHLPLAADSRDFEKAIRGASSTVRKKFGGDIALVGNLYKTDYAYYMGPLEQYERGFLEGLINSQSKVYGGYFLPEIIDEEFMDRINARYELAAKSKNARISKEQLVYMLSCEITSRERFLALSLLSNRFGVKHFAGKRDENLSKVEFMGYADYYSEMPIIFANSKINLNISLKTIRSGVPLRVFDVLACEGFLITNIQEEILEYFVSGEELAVYSNLEELVLLCDFYLKNPDEMNRIKHNGFMKIKNEFTYEKGLNKIFETIKNN